MKEEKFDNITPDFWRFVSHDAMNYNGSIIVCVENALIEAINTFYDSSKIGNMRVDIRPVEKLLWEPIKLLNVEPDSNHIDLSFRSEDGAFQANVFIESGNVTARLLSPDECDEIGWPFAATDDYEAQKLRENKGIVHLFGESIASRFRAQGHKVIYG